MPVEQVNDQRGARHSTAFYAESGTGLTVDLSQHATDITAGTNVVYESATTRLDGTGRRAIRWRLECVDTSSGYLWRHGTGAATEGLLIHATAGTRSLRVILNNAIVDTFTLGDVWPEAADGTETLRIAWTTTVNPATTGASDEMLSWLLVYNEDDDTYERHSFTHARKAATSATAYFGALDSAGTSAFDGTMLAIGYDRDVVSFALLEHDWGTVLPDTPTDEGLTERRRLPLPASSGIGGAGEFFGFAPQWAAANHHAARRRHFSPLVNERFPSPMTFSQLTISGGELWTPVPDGSGYYYLATAVRYRLVPEDASVAWVRAHFRAWLSDNGDDTEIGVRCYSFDAPPHSAELADVRFVEQVVSTAAAAGHVFHGLLTLARRDGMTWLALAAAFDPDAVGGSVGIARGVFSDWHAVPRAVDTGNGGLPVGGFGGG